MGSSDCSGPFGSHVLEKSLLTLNSSINAISEGDEKAILTESLESFVDTVCECLYDMIISKYGSFVARTLLCILSGKDVKNKSKSRGNQGGFEMNADATKHVDSMREPIAGKKSRLQSRTSSAQPPSSIDGIEPPYPAHLRKIALTTLGEDWSGENMKELQGDNFAGPFLQSLLRAVAGLEDELVEKLVIQFLGGNATAGPDSLKYSCIKELVTNRQGSHLVEAAFEACPDDMFNKLCSTTFKGTIVSLAQHPIANFVVQSAFSLVKRPKQFKKMFGDLKPHLGSLLESRRGGVVATIVAASARLACQQRDVADALWTSIKAAPSYGASMASPVHFLFVLDTASKLDEDRTGKKLSALGCTILLAILNLNTDMSKNVKDSSSEWMEAISLLNKDELIRVARDPGGCRVLEKFLASSFVAKKIRRSMLSTFNGRWGDIAHSAAGCRFVENCFAIADATQKEAIASDLASSESRVSSVYGGTELLNFCRVKEYKGNGASQWKQQNVSADMTRREFEALFST